MTTHAPRLSENLTTDQRRIWQKLSAFPFDSQAAQKPFSARLATEQGWSESFTAKVLEEYRRFLLLTVSAGHVVCPSEEVDAAWHQHLTYTRSYWNDLCRDVLGKPLHHDPTAGGPEQHRLHWDMYRQTLLSYHRIFGMEPPRDIWPLSFDRFDAQSQTRTVNQRDHWIVRKPTWWPRQWTGRGVALSALPLAAFGLGPFDLAGPQFLILFAIVYLVCLLGCILYRRQLRDVPVTTDRELTPDEVACLSFGRPAAVNATVAGMLHQDQLVSVGYENFFGYTDGKRVTFKPGLVQPGKDEHLARSLYQAASERPRTLIELQQAGEAETAAIDARLTDDGYFVDADRIWMIRVRSALMMLAVLVLGLVKIGIGVSRNKPILILLFGCIGVLVTALIMLFTIRRSLAGDRLVDALKTRHDDLKSKIAYPKLARDKVVLGAALFGATALEGAVFEDLISAWKSSARNGSGQFSSNGSGCTGGSGSGCGGSGCGGGGCGGGGCGGCGGG